MTIEVNRYDTLSYRYGENRELRMQEPYCCSQVATSKEIKLSAHFRLQGITLRLHSSLRRCIHAGRSRSASEVIGTGKGCCLADKSTSEGLVDVPKRICVRQEKGGGPSVHHGLECFFSVNFRA